MVDNFFKNQPILLPSRLVFHMDKLSSVIFGAALKGRSTYRGIELEEQDRPQVTEDQPYRALLKLTREFLENAMLSGRSTYYGRQLLQS